MFRSGIVWRRRRRPAGEKRGEAWLGLAERVAHRLSRGVYNLATFGQRFIQLAARVSACEQKIDTQLQIIHTQLAIERVAQSHRLQMLQFFNYVMKSQIKQCPFFKQFI